MPQLWRLTRNPYGRAVYDALGRAGITATVMHEYVRRLEDDDLTGSESEYPYAVEVCDPTRLEALDAPVSELESGEEAVAALENGTPRGYLFLSVDTTHRIEPLERSVAFEGAYIRRVFVDPEHRNRGVATAMVAAARRLARDRGAGRATALVALDNSPSRALFERHGFESRRIRRYVRAGPLSHRSTQPVRANGARGR